MHDANGCMHMVYGCQGRIQEFGKGGGGGGLINIFTTGGGYGRGHAPSRDSKGVWCFAPAAFLLLRLFSMKFTVISDTYISRDIRITRACMDSDEKTVHSSQCYGSYCSAIKFVTQYFCEFVTEACTWPCTRYMSVYCMINDSCTCMFYNNISIVSLFSSVAICFLGKRI